jgi:uncharacterized protein (TIGR02266 family)
VATNTHGAVASTPADRRSATRHEIELEVGMETDHNFYTGLTQDVSSGGLFVATHQLKRIGEHIKLKFKLPNMAAPVELDTEVRWVREAGPMNHGMEPGMGLKFINVPAEVKAAIESFLKQRDSLFYDDE